jgi:hypothetical protein
MHLDGVLHADRGRPEKLAGGARPTTMPSISSPRFAQSPCTASGGNADVIFDLVRRFHRGCRREALRQRSRDRLATLRDEVHGRDRIFCPITSRRASLKIAEVLGSSMAIPMRIAMVLRARSPECAGGRAELCRPNRTR